MDTTPEDTLQNECDRFLIGRPIPFTVEDSDPTPSTTRARDTLRDVLSGNAARHLTLVTGVVASGAVVSSVILGLAQVAS